MNLNELIEYYEIKLATHKHDAYDEESLAIAIEAMKKQVSMKVTSLRDTYPNEYGVTMYEYDCPNCGEPIEFESLGCYEPEYCDECGQKLDWED